MNTLATSQYQPKLTSITNAAPGGLANQIAVFISNEIIDKSRILETYKFGG